MIGKRVQIKGKQYTVTSKERSNFLMTGEDGNRYKITQKMFDRMGGKVVGEAELSKEDKYPQIAELIRWNRVFGREWDFPSCENTARRFIVHLESSLSPENLTCDGELSSAEISRKKAGLMALKKELEEVLGYQIELNY